MNPKYELNNFIDHHGLSDTAGALDDVLTERVNEANEEDNKGKVKRIVTIAKEIRDAMMQIIYDFGEEEGD